MKKETNYLLKKAQRWTVGFILPLFVLLLPSLGFAQDSTLIIGKPQLDIGVLYLSNALNQDNYFDYKTGSESQSNLAGGTIKFTFNTPLNYLDLILGAVYAKGLTKYSPGIYSPGNTNSVDGKANGGGVYVGLSPKLKGKYFGLTSDFGIGVFSFKETFAAFNNVDPPYWDIYEQKSSSGLGAMSSLGAYARFGRLGINPAVTLIFSGGQNSFTYYGLNVPLTFRF